MAHRTTKLFPPRRLRPCLERDSQVERRRRSWRFPSEAPDQAEPAAPARDSQRVAARRIPPEKLPQEKSMPVRQTRKGFVTFPRTEQRDAPVAQSEVRGALLALSLEGRLFRVNQAACLRRPRKVHPVSRGIRAHDCGGFCGGGGGGVRRDMRASIFAANSSSFPETSRRNDAVRRSVSGAISSST